MSSCYHFHIYSKQSTNWKDEAATRKVALQIATNEWGLVQWHLLSFCCDRWLARLSRAPSMASVDSFSRKFSRYGICRVDFWHLLPSLPLNAGGKFPLCCPSTSSAHKNKINKSNETLQVCLSRALRMVMPTIALLVSVRLTWHFLVVGVWVLLSPVHAFLWLSQRKWHSWPLRLRRNPLIGESNS